MTEKQPALNIRWWTNNKYECTIDQIRNWRIMLYRRRACATSLFTRWQHFSVWNDVVAAMLKLWRHISEVLLRQFVV